jgi:hypothetical protein
LGGCRYEDHAFAVRKRGRGEATDGAIQKLLILVQLDDVIARSGGGQKRIPRLPIFERIRVTSSGVCRGDREIVCRPPLAAL